MLEVDARINADGVLIRLLHDEEAQVSFVELVDEFSKRRLVAKDRAEAIEMYRHPFAYSHAVNVSDAEEAIARLAS